MIDRVIRMLGNPERRAQRIEEAFEREVVLLHLGLVDVLRDAVVQGRTGDDLEDVDAEIRALEEEAGLS
jgi:hypothetical protein